ncbi:uncharacterized protein LOC123792676 isoform X3 [Ursus americanus]|uniref:uncharacterized protein LOC123792676 isoform X3 n=1 Tax=Ursus americanus TaxID=9643 RepID=UPI001E67D145|nr:uncharacterized protein LOC123792676 isoform X3 [Ursus americanus]
MGPLIRGFQRPAGADGVRDLTMAPARSRCVLSEACFSFLFGRQRALGRIALGTLQRRCHCCGCYSPRQAPRSKQDVNSKTVVLEEICPVEGEPGSRLLVKQSQPIHDLPAGSPLLLPGERGLKEPTGTEKHDKGRRKSNKELEDFHGSQVLDGRPVASDGQNQGGACGCRGQTCLGKDGEEPVNLASSLLLIPISREK